MAVARTVGDVAHRGLRSGALLLRVLRSMSDRHSPYDRTRWRDNTPAATAWMAGAACKGMDTDLFFPPRGGPVVEAQRTCGRCPVRESCLAYAVANGETAGIWGGLTERQRRRERSRRYRGGIT